MIVLLGSKVTPDPWKWMCDAFLKRLGTYKGRCCRILFSKLFKIICKIHLNGTHTTLLCSLFINIQKRSFPAGNVFSKNMVRCGAEGEFWICACMPWAQSCRGARVPIGHGTVALNYVNLPLETASANCWWPKATNSYILRNAFEYKISKSSQLIFSRDLMGKIILDAMCCLTVWSGTPVMPHFAH